MRGTRPLVHAGSHRGRHATIGAASATTVFTATIAQSATTTDAPRCRPHRSMSPPMVYNRPVPPTAQYALTAAWPSPSAPAPADATQTRWDRGGTGPEYHSDPASPEHGKPAPTRHVPAVADPVRGA